MVLPAGAAGTASFRLAWLLPFGFTERSLAWAAMALSEGRLLGNITSCGIPRYIIRDMNEEERAGD